MLDKVMNTPSGDQALRRTFIVDTALAAREVRTRAARNRHHGCQVMSTDQAAARLAGGFLQPIPREHLQDAIQHALADTDIGPLNPVRELPGMTRAATATLQRAWDADLDLPNGDARQQALASLDVAACARLRPSMKTGCRSALQNPRPEHLRQQTSPSEYRAAGHDPKRSL
jgi:hypothetical protein